jgi:hypothetical protein
MEAKLVCEVDIEGTEGMMTRGKERDSGDERTMGVGIDK